MEGRFDQDIDVGPELSGKAGNTRARLHTRKTNVTHCPANTFPITLMRIWIMRKILSTFLVVVILALPFQPVWALALSDIQLNSALNQVLDAKVLLLEINKDELGSLQVNIDQNTDAAVEQSSIKLTPEVKENENGYYISITSKEVIKEPVLSFSLELSWSKGHLIREYSLLIDPR